ncbi:MAG TPA: formylglycine-generating enzyme family protein [Tepidisphaeraceae bacterium]|jgi:formylglycine-generating enzyme required for sulfatase activity|nr:formylglycine-generating enzyme family protein [Tepidisphaeraceae bacterium]
MLPVPPAGATSAPEPRPFWIGETEVTWDAYDVFLLRLDIPIDRRGTMEADPGADAVSRPTPPYAPPDRGWGHDHFPAISVTFEAARQYCRWLSEKTGRRYRLPTVTEWQYACRAGKSHDSNALSERAWFAENTHETTHRVATKKANAWGMYDMLGNVAEWCTDENNKPVACGGSFLSPAGEAQSSSREYQAPAWNQSDPSFPRSKWWLSDAPFVGFRVVCESPQIAK